MSAHLSKNVTVFTNRGIQSIDFSEFYSLFRKVRRSAVVKSKDVNRESRERDKSIDFI